MQAARGLVVPFAVVLELSAGVQLGQNQLEAGLAGLSVLVDRDATAVVRDRDRVGVLVQGQRDLGRVTVHRLVDRVVQDLPRQVMEPGAAHAADVHAGALADVLEPLQDGQLVCFVAHAIYLPSSSGSAGAWTAAGTMRARRPFFWISVPTPARAVTLYLPTEIDFCAPRLVSTVSVALFSSLARKPSKRSSLCSLISVTPLPGPPR